MNKLDALWEYQQAELALARLKREMKSSPSYQKRTKLHNFLAEQQASIEKINADMRAKDGSLATCSSKLDALLKRYDLEKSELDIMENDEESTAADHISSGNNGGNRWRIGTWAANSLLFQSLY